MGELRSPAYDFIILICELCNAINVLNQFEVLSRKRRAKSMGEFSLSFSLFSLAHERVCVRMIHAAAVRVH